MPSVEADTSYADRYEPLQDARKQDVHYRASKSKILRSLGTASYRNGSQFAMIWVSPTGEIADAYASEAFQPKLEDWLGKRVQAEARETFKAWKVDKERRSNLGEERVEVEGVYGTEGEMFRPDQIDEEMSDGEGVEDQYKGTRASHVTGATNSRRSHAGLSGQAAPEDLNPSSSRPNHRATRSFSTSDVNPKSHASPALSSTSLTSPVLTSSTLATDANGALKVDLEQVDAWLTARLAELSHKTDKIVCRSWIKAIEPHKQTKYQYQKGDETKPAWWPAAIRHKEPDHLGKHERIALLLHLLRLPSVTINQLECSTSAVSMQIPAHKLPILQSIYECARAERRAMQAGPSGTSSEGNSSMLSPPAPQNADAGREEDGELSVGPSPVLPGAELRSNRSQRTRNKNPIGSPNATDFAMTQQTPRSARASPYPLARSASATNELSNLSLNSATSPSLSHTPASTSLSRSQSHAGLNASTSRAPRLSGRASIGESDLQATPYQGGRVRTSITPRQAASQGSPLSASMGRSASTSAIGAKTMMDDSVASPAMIKSRSKLSQRCFEQMGAGPGGGPGEVRGGRVEYAGQQDFDQFSPQQFPMVHPHHLQQLRPHPEGFPPPPPVPVPQHHHLARHPHSQIPPRSQAQAHSHSQPSHLPRSSSQVPMQVHVHPGHGLPIPPEAQQNLSSYAFTYPPTSQGYSDSPVPAQPAHFSPDPHQQSQQPMHFIAPNGLVYEHSPAMLPQQVSNEEATYYLSPSAGGAPSLSGYINSPELAQHSAGLGDAREYLMVQNGANDAVEPFDTNYYLDPGMNQHESDEPDLGAYVRQLEGFERQHAQSGGAHDYEVGLGFEASGQHDLSTFAGHDQYY
ncbi:hypothetical protein JCM16303_004409 [Sporobolomyces ruberrimus]